MKILSRRLLWLLTLTAALSVGNVYYSQPLLGEIAKTFGKLPAVVGIVPTLTQLGYVVGLLFLTPLGDVLEKRRLVAVLLFLASLALLCGALSTNFFLFAASSSAIGLTSVLVQILIPFVASLSAPEERGKNLGLVLSAALIGILLSRTLSGFVGAHIGWRGMYFLASGLMFSLSIAVRLMLPRFTSSARIPYPKLIYSLWQMFRDLPELRAIAMNGALMYGALSAFWASLAFFLASPAYHLGSGVAGSFGLVGALGALAANFAGRHAERYGAKRVVSACIVLMLFAFVVMGAFGDHWAGLVLGVVLLDLGAQAATVSNQTLLYRVHPEAQTRLNTLYKTLYFIGGAAGSFSSTAAWQAYGWRGVCCVGLTFLAVAWIWSQRHKMEPAAAAK